MRFSTVLHYISIIPDLAGCAYFFLSWEAQSLFCASLMLNFLFGAELFLIVVYDFVIGIDNVVLRGAL